MIHFFLTFSKDAANSPFGRRLVELGVAHRIIAGEVRHRYRHRAWMLFVGRPQTAWFAIQAAFRSLVIERPRPDVVVVWTHIEVLVVAAMRALLRRRQTRIVLVGFILTERSGWLQQALRRVYFRTVFALVDLTVVHSSAEAGRYAALYAGSRSRFVFIPWGSHVEGAAALAAAAAEADAGEEPVDVLCAGKSGRDYPTLYRALAGTPWRVTVVCDLAEALAGCAPAPNIRVLTHCYGGDYLRLVARARCVVIPLAVGDISAGQMVLLQAMELGKAVVITRTQTTVDYAIDGRDALLVQPGDARSLQAAVGRLLDEPAFARRIAANARHSFGEKFTIRAFVSTLVEHICVGEPRKGAGPSLR